jgi:hypothetical protein
MPRRAKARHNFLINCIIYSNESILTLTQTRLISLCLLLKNVNETIEVLAPALIDYRKSPRYFCVIFDKTWFKRLVIKSQYYKMRYLLYNFITAFPLARNQYIQYEK